MIEQPPLLSLVIEENDNIYNDHSEISPLITSNSSQSSVTALRGNIASILNPILAQDNSNVEFNYLESIGDWNLVRVMHDQRRDEYQDIQREVELRISMITPDQLKTEIQGIFTHIERSTGIKRTRAK